MDRDRDVVRGKGVGVMSEPVMRRALIAIGVITALSGATQAAAPSRVLRPLSVRDDDTSRQLFATVGMFMVVVGGALVNALLGPARAPMVVFWAMIQKFGAAGAVTIGVRRGVFSPLALAVASFDFLSGVLAGAYWKRTRRS